MNALKLIGVGLALVAYLAAAILLSAGLVITLIEAIGPLPSFLVIIPPVIILFPVFMRGADRMLGWFE